jgi:cytochrome c-type biogenesis protein
VGLAFLAGLLSFISPCVLPLVPAYIGYMGGRLSNTVAARAAVADKGVALPRTTFAQRFVTLLHGLAFVAGFTFIFIVLGLLATAFVFQVGRQNLSFIETLISRVGGLFVIFFGLHFMGLWQRLFSFLLARPRLIGNPLLSIAFALLGGVVIAWALMDALLILPVLVVFLLWLVINNAFTNPAQFWTNFIGGIQRALYSEVRMQMTARGNQSFASSALMGVVFAAGWTPCIGPVYGAVLTMAANGGDVGEAGVLLGAYSLGLGLPFLLTALALDSVQGFLKRIQRRMHTVELATGALLVFIGVLVASGQLQQLSATFANQFTDVSVRVEECGIGFANGEISFSELGPCLSGEPLETTAADNNTAIAAPMLPAIEDIATSRPSTITGIASTAGSESDTVAPPGIEVGQQAPNFAINYDDGTSSTLAELRGQIVLVNFWATWCGPCRVEMPEFERAYNAHADDGFTILAINNGETVDVIDAFRDEMDVTFPMALDEMGDIQDLFAVPGYPTTLLLDRNGVIVARHVGPMTAEDIDTLVATALG